MGGRSGQSVNRLAKANAKIDNLPKGKIFDDAKRIDGVFSISKHSYSETIETFEKNIKNGKLAYVNTKDIEITQPNIQSDKIKSLISNLDNTPVINVVEFKDGRIVIFDGHHRLVANWALGKERIRVNLVKEE